MTQDTDVARTVRTPCCDTEVRLIEREFVHDGSPRRDERLTFTHWTVICPACDRWLRCGIEERRRARNVSVLAGLRRYSTYRKLIGAPYWTDPVTHEPIARTVR